MIAVVSFARAQSADDITSVIPIKVLIRSGCFCICSSIYRLLCPPPGNGWFFNPDLFGVVRHGLPAAIRNAAIPARVALHFATLCRLHSFTRKPIQQNRT